MFHRAFIWSTLAGMMSCIAGCAGTHEGSSAADVNRSANHKTPQNGLAIITDEAMHPHSAKTKAAVVYEMRKFPYPYDAMLAISSDADSETLRKFNLVHEFINTKSKTPIGRGLGLDFSDSFFMYNGDNLHGAVDINQEPMSDELTYFKGVTTKPYGAFVINQYIQNGWIDTMHSYGDFSQINQKNTLFKRELAKQGVAVLKSQNIGITVWTDHGNKSNVDNFGAYGKAPFYAYQQGATPTSKYYHTNWTIPYGIKFVWADLSSDDFGMRSVIFPIMLSDGRRVWGFWRYTNENYTQQGDPDWNWTPFRLNEQLTPVHLSEIEKKHEISIIAQHLSGTIYPGALPSIAIQSLKALAKEQDKGHILVARTSRLLQYNVAEQYVSFDVTKSASDTYIHIRTILDPVFGAHVPTLDEIRGLTFYTSNPSSTVIDIGDQPIPADMVQTNKSDGIHPSIGVKWYPKDTTDYTITDPSVK